MSSVRTRTRLPGTCPRLSARCTQQHCIRAHRAVLLARMIRRPSRRHSGLQTDGTPASHVRTPNTQGRPGRDVHRCIRNRMCICLQCRYRSPSRRSNRRGTHCIRVPFGTCRILRCVRHAPPPTHRKTVNHLYSEPAPISGAPPEPPTPGPALPPPPGLSSPSLHPNNRVNMHTTHRDFMGHLQAMVVTLRLGHVTEHPLGW